MLLHYNKNATYIIESASQVESFGVATNIFSDNLHVQEIVVYIQTSQHKYTD